MKAMLDPEKGVGHLIICGISIRRRVESHCIVALAYLKINLLKSVS